MLWSKQCFEEYDAINASKNMVQPMLWGIWCNRSIILVNLEKASQYNAVPNQSKDPSFRYNHRCIIVRFKLQALVCDILEEGAGKRCSECASDALIRLTLFLFWRHHGASRDECFPLDYLMLHGILLEFRLVVHPSVERTCPNEQFLLAEHLFWFNSLKKWEPAVQSL